MKIGATLYRISLRSILKEKHLSNLMQGQYEIISLSGSFMLSENNGTRSRTGGLSVLLAGSDGQVLGGGVAGMLMASSQVQVQRFFFFFVPGYLYFKETV